jgi:aldose 1-epimerase
MSRSPERRGAAVTREAFGTTPEGRDVALYTCTSARGLTLRIMDYGATVVALETPDREGRLANLTLGFETLEGYLGDQPHFGATIGRYCNRIARARFTLDGRRCALTANEGPNHLHGGRLGFDKVLWDAKPLARSGGVGVTLRYVSRAGEEGYPGTLEVTAAYCLHETDELSIEFTAQTDAATPVNLTNHCYWNLGGAGNGTIRGHVLELDADHYLPVDAGLIPTGRLARVAGTPLDFTRPGRIGAGIDRIGSEPAGFDHCYMLRATDDGLRRAARLTDPVTGRVMEVHTTQPAVQLYTANSLAGSPAVNGYRRWAGLCLETQHPPDAPNRPTFPTTILRPGETYSQKTVHRFRID